MAITENPKLEYESGQSFNDWEHMSDTGDAMVFEATFAPWSARAGFDASVRPWGLATGGQIRAGSGNDNVTVSALSAYMPTAVAAEADGVVNVASGDVSVSRAATATHMITSITVDASGALEAISGTEGSAFTEQRGEAGGPPFIPVESIEIGQVRVNGADAAPVSDTQIMQVVGLHQERYDSPVFEADPATGEVHFAAELPRIHTGSVTKKVSVRGYTPIFAEIPRASDWVPAETSHSTTSTEIYNGTLGSVSRSLGQASFTYYGEGNANDPLVRLKNQRLWFRWYQDRNRSPFSLTQGILGIGRTYPAGDHVNIACTVSAEQETADFE
ncbi:hypothetical protein [Halomonas sp. TD01]|uniref:hypothetical protein n=1 Tax=Halomonas sp. TD01 TaxID=999141 RepID=UPI000214E5E0|nr:hypothetical protein [Halomonas sp. TD01]EGP18536.1 hypothetical protein GME_16392 [Halomonas sp. TD01]CAH1044566.1 hypothetical protein HPTD01_3044 [Halomonas sp. TD01]